MILPVFEKQYNQLKRLGFQSGKADKGPTLNVGFVPCPREPLEALENGPIKVYFYDMPTCCVIYDDKQVEMSFFIKDEFENFLRWAQFRLCIHKCTKATTVKMTFRPDLHPEKNVCFSVEDESGYPLLTQYTIEEMQSLDDERLFGIMCAFDSIQGLFEEVVRLRNERNRKVAEELEKTIGEKIEMPDLPRGIPSKTVQKLKED